MKNQQNSQGKSPNGSDKNKNDLIGGASDNSTNPEVQNDTGYAGTTNSVSKNNNYQNKDGYKIAIEDTMIGYDGHEEQLDMDLGEEETRRFGKTGIDDND
jgi:hypothetical protein